MKGAEHPYQGRGLIADPIHQYILYTRPRGLAGEATEQDLIDTAWVQRIIREELADILKSLRRSPSGAFEAGESIDPEWICYLMGKSYTQPLESHPRWLPHLKPLLSGVYTADNMDYVLRDAYMCGVAVGPIDIERIIHYSFFSEEGLTIHRG